MIVFILLVCIFKQAVRIMIRAQQVTWHGLVIYLPIFVMVLVPILLTMFTQKTTKNQLKIMAGIIAIITACGGGIFHLTNNTNDTVIYSQATQCLEQIDKNYRVKFISDNYLSFNATTLGVKSINTFSSLSHKNLNSGLNQLGYNTATNWVKSCGGTVLSDIFVGNKYVLSEYKINYSYLKLIEEKDNCYLYENLLCGKLGKVLQNEPKFTNDFVANQNVLFNSLGGSGNVIEKISPELTLENCNVVNSFYKAQKEREAYKIKVNYNFTENKLLYLCVKPQSQEKSYNMSFENGFVIEKDGLVPIFNEDCLNINCLENMPVESLSFYEMDLQKIENLNYQDFDVKELYSGFSAEINLTENSTVFLPMIIHLM